MLADYLSASGNDILVHGRHARSTWELRFGTLLSSRDKSRSGRASGEMWNSDTGNGQARLARVGHIRLCFWESWLPIY